MATNKYSVIVSDAALAMLDSHADFLARVNKKSALKVTSTILNDIESLNENPLRFPAYDNQFITGVNYRKMLSSKRYLIVYEVSDKSVFVDYIIDCRQNNEWLIR